MTVRDDHPLKQVNLAIAKLRGQLWRAVAARLFWQALAGAVAFAWAFLIVDRVLEPTPSVRGLLLAAAALPALVWLLAIAAPRLVRRITRREVLGLAALQAPREADLAATAFDLENAPTASDALAAATRNAANSAAQRLGELRLVRPVASMAVVSFASVGALGLIGMATARPDLAACYAKRVALDDAPWPRRVRLVVEGFDFDDATNEWRRVAARGEPAELSVTATVAPGRTPPSTVWSRGLGGPTRLSTLTRLASQGGDESERRFRKRFPSLDGDVACVLRCGDARLRLRLVAADRPRLTDLRITAEPPAYLNAPAINATPGTLESVPEGARVTIATGSTREIQSVAARPQTDAADLAATIADDRQSASIDVGTITDTAQFVLSVTDAYGLSSEPITLDLECKQDAPASAGLTVEGVGRAITRDAVLPLAIRVDDDHRVREVTVEVTCDERTAQLEATPPASVPATVDREIDLLSLRSADRGRSIALEPGDKLLLTALVVDAYDLRPREPSRSAPIQLEVVSPTELLALLADAQRELRSAIDTLQADTQRLGYELDLQRRRLAEGAPPEDTQLARWAGERLLDARKTAQGVNGAMTRAENLSSQVVNNRLDQPALAERLTLRVATPLSGVLEREFGVATRRLSAIAKSPADDPTAAVEVAQAAVARIAETLSAASAALETQDTYNEVVAMLRALVRDQRRVNERTTAASKASARRLLLE